MTAGAGNRDPARFARFPTLRLAVAPDEVEHRADVLGLRGLPVTRA